MVLSLEKAGQDDFWGFIGFIASGEVEVAHSSSCRRFGRDPSEDSRLWHCQAANRMIRPVVHGETIMTQAKKRLAPRANLFGHIILGPVYSGRALYINAKCSDRAGCTEKRETNQNHPKPPAPGRRVELASRGLPMIQYCDLSFITPGDALLPWN